MRSLSQSSHPEASFLSLSGEPEQWQDSVREYSEIWKLTLYLTAESSLYRCPPSQLLCLITVRPTPVQSCYDLGKKWEISYENLLFFYQKKSLNLSFQTAESNIKKGQTYNVYQHVNISTRVILSVWRIVM